MSGTPIVVPAGANWSITGAGDATLDGGDLSRIFEVSGRLSLRDLRLTRGNANTHIGRNFARAGGLVLGLPGADISFDGCTFDSSTAPTGRGGAISVWEANLYMRGCTLRGCSATMPGADGTLDLGNPRGIAGGIDILINAYAIIEDCEISEMYAETLGGAIGVEYNGVLEMYRCHIHNCTTQGSSAGIVKFAVGINQINEMVVSECTFADLWGATIGAIYVLELENRAYQHVLIDRCTFVDCFGKVNTPPPPPPPPLHEPTPLP